jgi:hypothetical protein
VNGSPYVRHMQDMGLTRERDVIRAVVQCACRAGETPTAQELALRGEEITLLRLQGIAPYGCLSHSMLPQRKKPAQQRSLTSNKVLEAKVKNLNAYCTYAEVMCTRVSSSVKLGWK